jgi:hypothetical protein
VKLPATIVFLERVTFPARKVTHNCKHEFKTEVRAVTFRNEGDIPMKKAITLALALATLTILSVFAAAQHRGEVKDIAVGPIPQVSTKVQQLTCCECLGGVTTLNLSTGQSSPKDPFWSVNGNAAYTTPKVSSWVALAGAQWIQPAASPLPSNNIAPGLYKYVVKFFIPECTIRSQIQLTGKFSADNSAKAFLDTPAHAVGSCSGPTCFTAGVPLAVNPAWLTPGNHTLEIDVTNNEGYSGLIVNASLTRQCVRGNPGAAGPNTEAN